MDALRPTTVDEILAGQDLVLRNFRITAGYHQLTLGMVELFGERDFTWPIFATWASRQAGRFIRKEFIPGTLRPLLERPGDAPEGVAELLAVLPAGPHPGDRLLETADAIADAVSLFISGGNTIVFEDLGRAFALFIERFASPEARTEAELAELLARYREGASEPDLVRVGDTGQLEIERRGGQTLIRESLTHFFHALHERDDDARAELILLANAKAGYHEQIRLQPYIAGALDGPTHELLRLAGAEDALHAEELTALVRRIVTELMMILELPGQVLHLGGDLPAGTTGVMWPPHLEELDNPELLALTRELGAYETREANLALHDRIEGWLNPMLARLHLAEREAQGTGARDWASLSDRMRYIFAYFRSRQGDPALLASPFSDAAMTEILAGRMPSAWDP